MRNVTCRAAEQERAGPESGPKQNPDCPWNVPSTAHPLYSIPSTHYPCSMDTKAPACNGKATLHSTEQEMYTGVHMLCSGILQVTAPRGAVAQRGTKS